MSLTIKVATYNIHKCVGLDRKRDPHRIINVLHEIDADIIALQESDRRFGRRLSCLPLEMLEKDSPWRHAPLNIRPGGMGWHGNALLVKKHIDVRSIRPLHLPTLEPRGAIEAELLVSGRAIRVIGVHLDLSGLWRRQQIRWLLRHLDDAPHNMPTIIMGDFNQWSNKGALSEFAYHHHRILKSPPSFHSARPIAALDRIIISHDIRADTAEAHKSELSRVASDHLPVMASLRI
jgi:endonuclease/exonuclease/phosphatase family metal-dependent hydrolase